MKNTLHFFLTLIFLLSGADSFAEKKSNDSYVCPTASITYASTMFCNSANVQAVNLTGTDAYLGGTFSSTSGLNINPATGAITPSTSTPGFYTVIYTIPSGPGCPSTMVTTTVEIVAQANAGTDGNMTICESNSSTINLFTLISGEQTGGIWTRITGSGGTFNAAAGTFTPTMGVTTSAFMYTVSGTSPCSSDSSIVTIMINPQPNAGTDGGITVCDTNSIINLYNLITGEQAGGTWVRISGTGGTFNAGAGTFTLTSGTTNSTFIYTLTSSAPCLNDSSEATVTINALPTITSITADQTTICNDQFVTFISNSNPSATAYNWQVNSASGVQIVGGATSGTSSTGIIDLQLTLTSPMTAGTISFDFTPVNGICIGATITDAFTITVNPIPGTPISLPNNEICSGETTNYNISTIPNIAGTMLEWTVTDSQNVTGFTLNGSGLSPLNISDVLVNTSNVQGFVKYSITSKLGDCEGGTTDYIVLVNPLPNTGSSGNISVSEASTTPIDLFSIISGEESGGIWTRISGTGGTFDAGTGTFTPEVGATESYFNYELTNNVTSCSNNSLAIVNIDVVPVGMANTTNQTINNGNYSNVILSSSNVPGSNFTWTFTANNISGASNGSGTTISQQLSLIDPNLDGYVDYTITPVNNSANGSSFAARVSIQSILNAETFMGNSIKLSPNPVTDILNIENEYQINSIKIYNQLGQMVFGKEINNNKTQLDLSVINSGIYNVLIETEKGTINHKIVKK